MTTGAVFALVTVAHVWRIVAESPSLARDPWFVLLTLFTAGLSVWAWRLFASRVSSPLARPIRSAASEADRPPPLGSLAAPPQ